jgi:hypothetical protein
VIDWNEWKTQKLHKCTNIGQLRLTKIMMAAVPLRHFRFRGFKFSATWFFFGLSVRMTYYCGAFAKPLLPWQRNKYIYFSVCVYARVYGCPSAWVCACAFARAALRILHATLMRHTISSCVVSLSPSYFSTLSHKWQDFRGNLLNRKRMCFDFLYNFYLQHFSF